MNDERRGFERSPNFRNVELVTTEPGGTERAYPVILRDTSGRGYGGMYVGQETLSPTRDFVLREGSSNVKVRIVWAKRVAAYVQMLGLEVAETGSTQSTV